MGHKTKIVGLRGIAWVGFTLCLAIMLHWIFLLVSGSALVWELSEHLEMGSNGLAFRVLYTPDSETDIAWDVLGNKPELTSTSYRTFIQIPIPSLFLASLALLLGAVFFLRRIQRRDQAPKAV